MAKMLASNCDALAVTSGALLLLLLRPPPLPLALLHHSILVASHQHHPEEIVISFGNRATMRTDNRVDQRANVPFLTLTYPALPSPPRIIPYLTLQFYVMACGIVPKLAELGPFCSGKVEGLNIVACNRKDKFSRVIDAASCTLPLERCTETDNRAIDRAFFKLILNLNHFRINFTDAFFN